MNRPPASLVALWVLICAWLNIAGWVLSAMHQLNRGGYLAVLVLGAGLAIYGWRVAGASTPRRRPWHAPRARWRRGMPRVYFLLSALVILGGLLHAPNNYDALAYRIPRTLNWLADGHWSWLSTQFARLNTRACGFEWVSTPLILFGRTERWVWLINLTAFLLMPGLIFSVFTRLGIRPRAAWHWMWILPSGYSFVLQAGSIGNDLYGAVCVLAMMHFALRARTSLAFPDAALAILGGALAMGAKTSNLPLMLPAALALLPCWRLPLQRPLATTVLALAAALSSFVPMAVLNAKYCGDWSGARYENVQLINVPAGVGIAGNTLALAVQNLQPPIFPFAAQWNAWIVDRIPRELHRQMLEHFEPSAADLKTYEMHNEEGASLGVGLCILVALSCIAALRAHHAARPEVVHDRWLTVIRWSPVISLLVYMTNSAVGTVARIVTPYYPLLLPILLVGARMDAVVTRRWWRWTAYATGALAALLLVFTPSRPLWPACTVLGWLSERSPQSPAIGWALRIYTTYSMRADALEPLRRLLPAEQTVFGLVTFDDPETSLWRPFGSRRFFHVVPADTWESLRARGIEYVVIKTNELKRSQSTSLEDWLAVHRAVVEHDVQMRFRSGPDLRWVIVRLASS